MFLLIIIQLIGMWLRAEATQMWLEAEVTQQYPKPLKKWKLYRMGNWLFLSPFAFHILIYFGVL